MPYATVHNVRTYYECAGSGEPLVLLHGFTGSSESWADHVNSFARHYLTITIDLIGHGRSGSPADPARYDMKQVTQDVIALLGELVSESVNLLGYSMGGRLALNLAITRPLLVRRLILESASPGLPSQVERQERVQQDESLARSIIRDGVPVFVQRWENMPIFDTQKKLSESIRTRLRRQRRKNSAVGLANSLRGMGAGAQPSLWSRLSELNMPTLLIVGEDDHKFVGLARKMSAALSCAQVEVVPEAGHTIHLEKPERFNHLVIRFLNDSR